MKITKLLQALAGMLILSVPLLSRASDNKPVRCVTLKSLVLSDTIPAKPQAAADATPVVDVKPVVESKPVVEAIKVVPKVKRLVVPVPVIQVKPVKVIKPKIVKPIIKLLP